MDTLEVNSYISAAEEALHNDPDYQRWFNALVEQRINAKERGGCDIGKVEGILFEMWNAKIGYILDHRKEIEEKIKQE